MRRKRAYTQSRVFNVPGGGTGTERATYFPSYDVGTKSRVLQWNWNGFVLANFLRLPTRRAMLARQRWPHTQHGVKIRLRVLTAASKYAKYMLTEITCSGTFLVTRSEARFLPAACASQLGASSENI